MTALILLTQKYPCAVQGYFPFYSYYVSKKIDKNVKYHIVYKTTNLINGKWYIGKHTTDNIEDGYLGSGQHLKSAIKKYGKENFTREILVFCDSEEEAYIKEAELVTMEVVNDPNSYNKMPGGEGGQKRLTNEELKEHKRESNRNWKEVNHEREREWKQEWYQANKERLRECHREYYQANKELLREYYQANKERYRENRRKWREANRERERENQRRWHEANRDRVREYYDTNRERRKEYKRKWREAHRDEINAKQRAWRAKNKKVKK